MKFKHALLFHKLYNSENETQDWLDIFFNQNFNERNNKVNFVDARRFNKKKNLLSNRFTCINDKITYSSLNLSYGAFKNWCKKEFI